MTTAMTTGQTMPKIRWTRRVVKPSARPTPPPEPPEPVEANHDAPEPLVALTINDDDDLGVAAAGCSCDQPMAVVDAEVNRWSIEMPPRCLRCGRAVEGR